MWPCWLVRWQLSQDQYQSWKGCTGWLEAHSESGSQCCWEGALARTRFRLRCPTPVLFFSVTTCWLCLIDWFELRIDCVGLSCSLSVSREASNSPNVPRWRDWFWAHLRALCGRQAQISAFKESFFRPTAEQMRLKRADKMFISKGCLPGFQ